MGRSPLRTYGMPVAAALSLASLVGCSSSSNDQQSKLFYFAATKQTIYSGTSLTIAAGFKGGTATVDHGVGDLTSGIGVTVAPVEDTTYSLTFKGKDGKEVTDSATVKIIPASELNAQPNLTVEAPHASGWTNPAGIADPTFVPTDRNSGADPRCFGNWPYDKQDVMEYHFDAPASVQHSAVYWWTDDTSETGDDGGVGAPSAYKVQYWDMAKSVWVDVANPRSETFDGKKAWMADPSHPSYQVSYNAYNRVGFEAVTTTALRLLMEPRNQPGDYPRSLGIQSWKVWGQANIPVTPVITSFSSNFPTISAGQITQLVPVFKYGTGTIEPGVGEVQSGVAVNLKPTAKTTYTLTVTNAKGEAVTSTTQVDLTPLTGAAYPWPSYTPDLNYNYKEDFGDLAAPTKVLDDNQAVVGTAILTPGQLPAGVTSPWWCFRWGPDANPLVTSASWVPMLQRYEKDFSYFRDVIGWPPDKRAKRGYYSSVYLYGSGLGDGASNTDKGGWQSAYDYQGESWPMVLISYEPVYAFDPANPATDKSYQQGAVIHEGIHSVLADMDGCKEAAWFQEGGNTALQGATEAYKAALAGDTHAYDSMGWLSLGTVLAPFMPIESYSGWLQDGSFGGPAAQGVNVYKDDGTKICTWRRLLGGVQYSEAFAQFMTECVSPGSVAWIWKHCTGTVLEGLANGRHETVDGKVYNVDGLGDAQVRRLILEFRSRLATCDYGKWSHAYRQLLLDHWGATMENEGKIDGMPDLIPDAPVWTANPYAKTTSDGAATPTLTPDPLTLPGWSGANLIPLTVKEGATQVQVDFTPLGAGMMFQLTYRDTDGKVTYSKPVAGGLCQLDLPKAPEKGVVFAVAVNTDYVYKGEETRKAKFDYRLALTSGLDGAADTSKQYF